MAYIGRAPVNGFHAKQTLTGDGSTTSFTLDQSVATESSIIVSVGGVLQEPKTAYNLTIGGTKIDFTAAPSSTDRVYIQYLGVAIVQNVNDINGSEFVLDVNGNTSLTADTDDEIDIRIGGTDRSTIKATGFHNIDSVKFVAGTGDDLQLYHDGSNSYLANSTGALKIATETSGIAITLGHTTSEITVADNMTVAGDLTVTGTASFGDTNITNVGSITLDSILDDGGTITLDSSGDIVLDAAGNDIFFKAGGTTFGSITNASTHVVIKDGTTTAATFAGANVTFAGTINSGAITSSGIVTGTAFTAGSAVLAEAELELLDGLTAGTAIASKVVTTDASIDTTGQRNLTITGELDAATGDFSSDVDVAGALTAASLGVDDVAINGKVITMTGSTDDTFTTTVAANGATSLVTVDTAAAAANIQITADGTVDIDSAGVLTLDSGAAINIEPASGSAILLDGTISIDAGVVTGATSITSTAFVGGITGNVTGNASGTALTVTQAAQTAITSLGTLTALTVDDVVIDGKVMTMTGSSGDTFVTTVAANGATSLVTVDAGGAAGHLTITADGTVDINSAGVLTLDSGAAINIEPAAGSAILLDGTISIDAGVVTGATSITSTAFVGDITGDVTGTADVATVATTVTITDNESTNESNAIIFTAGGDVDGGNIGLESDGTLTYNPSTGKVTATGFVGTLTGAVTGNVAGNLTGTVATVTQNSITTMTGLVTTGALNSGTIATGFGAIDNGASNITTGGLINVDVDADANDNTADSSTGRLTVGASGDLTLYHHTNSYVVNKTGNLIFHSETDDSDIIFTGEDGSSGITALTLDMSAAGAATFNNDVTAFSDARLKDNVETIDNALDKVTSMRGVTFTRNDNPDGGRQMGVIAQELQDIIPEVVKVNDDELNTLSVSYGNIVGVLIEAIKEQQVQIEGMQKEITELKK